jgi:hypothetical protein
MAEPDDAELRDLIDRCNPPSPSTGARQPRHGGPFRTRPHDGPHPDHPP